MMMPGGSGSVVQPAGYRFPPGLEEVYWGVQAREKLPEVMDAFGYQRALILSSCTLNRSTDQVSEIAAALEGRLIAVSDEVGEHAPISNVVKAVVMARETGADVIVCIGGGSVTDFGKFVQLGVTAGADTREKLLEWKQLRQENVPDPLQPPEHYGPMKVRQIAIPTTFSTGALTYGGTPVDDVTGGKVGLLVRQGAPRAVIYDPDIVRFTPSSLLASTGVRSLDHSVNNVLAIHRNAFGVEVSFAGHCPLSRVSASWCFRL